MRAAAVWLCMIMTVTGGTAKLRIRDARFTLDGEPAFLLGISHYGGLGAPREFVAEDFKDLAAAGFNWVRVWATWTYHENDVSAVDADGNPREPYISNLKHLVETASARGIVVDVTLSRGVVIESQEAHLRAVETLVDALKPYGNVYIDLANERDIRDARYVSFDELRELRDRLKQIDPNRLVTASGDSDPERYLTAAGLDFFSPHLSRNPDSPAKTQDITRGYLARMEQLGCTAPVHYQEPFRRDYGSFVPGVADFRTDLQGDVRGGAAGWCLHNGSPRGPLAEGRTRPRRSFDLRPEEGRLMDQLDEVELEVVRKAKQWLEESASNGA